MSERDQFVKTRADFHRLLAERDVIEKPFRDAMNAATAHLDPILEEAEDAFEAAKDVCGVYLSDCEHCAL